MLIILAIGVFISAVAFDFADSANTQAVTQGKPHQAALWSCAMYIIGLVGFYALVDVSWWLAIPECAGLYVGSWFAVTHYKGKKPNGEASKSIAQVCETSNEDCSGTDANQP